MGFHILTLEVEDIYFHTWSSKRGAPISLVGPRGGNITIDSLIAQYYNIGIQMSGKKIPIKDVMDIPLRTILFTMQRVPGSHATHQDSRARMLYALECMAPTIINWAEGLLMVLKDQPLGYF